MKQLKISEIKEISEFKNFYGEQDTKDLEISYQTHGQLNPVHVSEDNELINGYRIISAIKKSGGEYVNGIVLPGKPSIAQRISLNTFRKKLTQDQIKEIKSAFEIFPKKQGVKTLNGNTYSRHENISSLLNNRWSGDKSIQKLETIVNCDLERNIILKGIVEKNWKLDPCFEFVTMNMKCDIEKNWGYTEKLKTGQISIDEANNLINSHKELDNIFDNSFVIPNKAQFFNKNCDNLPMLIENQKQIDLVVTSIPYYDLHDYEVNGKNQGSHEKSKEEYAQNMSEHFKKITPLLKETANVIINIGETYRNGGGLGIPYLIKDYIDKNTELKYKGTLFWSKKNPKPQNEKVKRPTDNVELLLWYCVNPDVAKYNVLKFPDKNKKPKLTKGAKNQNSKGQIGKKRSSASKLYGKIVSHLEEQKLENIIVTSIGKDHELYKISPDGHPAPMSPTLPITLTLMLSDENDLVCDPFGGSNVVGKSALLFNRRYVATENNKKYFNIGCQRLINADNDFDRESLDEINKMVYPNQAEISKAA